ncbi:hypothetical protein ES705_42707 [subsurface metagenome]
MERLSNVHPGEILLEEFLRPMEITAYRLSKDTEIPQTRISQIIKRKRRITADTALRLSSYFGNSAKFWLGLQDDYDIEEERNNHVEIFNKIRQIRNKTHRLCSGTVDRNVSRFFSYLALQKQCDATPTTPYQRSVRFNFSGNSLLRS